MVELDTITMNQEKEAKIEEIIKELKKDSSESSSAVAIGVQSETEREVMVNNAKVIYQTSLNKFLNLVQEYGLDDTYEAVKLYSKVPF